MKPSYSITSNTLFRTLIFIVSFIVFTSCQKEVSDLSVHLVKADNSPRGAIIVQNNSPSQVHITLNGVAIEKNLLSNASDTLYGTPLATAKLVVETVTVDINDNPAGEQLVLQYALAFPEDKKSFVQGVNVSPDFFFVNVINLSNAPANQLAVSEPGIYGVINCDMTILNKPDAVACGYYPTHNLVANIKVVRNTEAMSEWNFANIQLPGAPNQAITLTCN
jgi:hypothetical protein